MANQHESVVGIEQLRCGAAHAMTVFAQEVEDVAILLGPNITRPKLAVRLCFGPHVELQADQEQPRFGAACARRAVRVSDTRTLPTFRERKRQLLAPTNVLVLLTTQSMIGMSSMPFLKGKSMQYMYLTWQWHDVLKYTVLQPGSMELFLCARGKQTLEDSRGDFVPQRGLAIKVRETTGYLANASICIGR